MYKLLQAEKGKRINLQGYKGNKSEDRDGWSLLPPVGDLWCYSRDHRGREVESILQINKLLYKDLKGPLCCFKMTFGPARKYTRTHTHTHPLSPDRSPRLTLCLSACSSASPSWRHTPCQQWSSARSQWLAGRRRRARKRATPKPHPSSNQRESPSPGTLMGSSWRSPTKCSSGLMFGVIITKTGNCSTNKVIYLLTHLTFCLSFSFTPLGLKVLASEISAPTTVYSFWWKTVV